MYCPNCKAYVPAGLSDNKCFECSADLPLQGPQQDPTPSMPAVSKEIAQAQTKQLVPASEEVDGAIIAAFQGLKNIFVPFVGVSIFLIVLLNGRSMRMDPFAGLLLLGPILLPVKLVSFFMYFALLMAIGKLAGQLRKRSFIYVDAWVLVVGELILSLLIPLIGTMVVPFWLYLYCRDKFGPFIVSDDKQVRSCPQCNASNNRIFHVCWKCKYEFEPDLARLNLKEDKNEAVGFWGKAKFIIQGGLWGITLYGAVIYTALHSHQRIFIIIFGYVPGAIAAWIDPSTINNPGFIFYFVGVLFWAIVGALYGVAFLPRANTTRRIVISTAITSSLVVLWFLSVWLVETKAGLDENMTWDKWRKIRVAPWYNNMR